MPAATGALAIGRTPIPGHSRAMALTALGRFAEPVPLAAAKDEHAHRAEHHAGRA